MKTELAFVVRVVFSDDITGHEDAIHQKLADSIKDQMLNEGIMPGGCDSATSAFEVKCLNTQKKIRVKM